MAKCNFVYETGRLEGRQCIRQAVEGCDGFCKLHFDRKLKTNISAKAKKVKAKERVRDLVNAQDEKKERDRLTEIKKAKDREKRLRAKKETRDQDLEEIVGKAIEKRTSDQDTLTLLKNGKIDIEDLSWDELVGGFIYLRNENGDIVDRREPIYFPREYYMRVTRALTIKAEQLFRNEFNDAMSALAGLVKGSKTPARERYLAATYIIERVIGKIPEKQDVNVQVSKFQELAGSAQLIIDVEEPDIFDAEIIDD
jgi:hypothetical protein